MGYGTIGPRKIKQIDQQRRRNETEESMEQEQEKMVITNGAPDGESTMEPLSSLVSTAEPATETATAFTPEHLKVAKKLFETHKQHVDQIMETLKVEMEAMKDFETLMSESHSRRTRLKTRIQLQGKAAYLAEKRKANVLA